MTGRDLIIYILSNSLEDKPVFENGKLLGFMTPEEAATRFEVGAATIYIWAELGMIEHVLIADQLYIPMNAKLTLLGGK